VFLIDSGVLRWTWKTTADFLFTLLACPEKVAAAFDNHLLPPYHSREELYALLTRPDGDSIIDLAVMLGQHLNGLLVLIDRAGIDINAPADLDREECPFDLCFYPYCMDWAMLRSAVALLRAGAVPRSQTGNRTILHSFSSRCLVPIPPPPYQPVSTQVCEFETLSIPQLRLLRELLALLAPFGIDFASRTDDGWMPLSTDSPTQMGYRKHFFGGLLLAGLISKDVGYRIVGHLEPNEAYDAFAIMCDTDVAQVGDTIPPAIVHKCGGTDTGSLEAASIRLSEEMKTMLANYARAHQFGYDKFCGVNKNLINAAVTQEDLAESWDISEEEYSEDPYNEDDLDDVDIDGESLPSDDSIDEDSDDA
jgi:hypothetical protein